MNAMIFIVLMLLLYSWAKIYVNYLGLRTGEKTNFFVEIALGFPILSSLFNIAAVLFGLNATNLGLVGFILILCGFMLYVNLLKKYSYRLYESKSKTKQENPAGPSDKTDPPDNQTGS